MNTVALSLKLIKTPGILILIFSVIFHNDDEVFFG